MNTSPREHPELEDQLRQSLDRLTVGARLRDGVAPLIRCRVHQARRTRYAAVAGATAVIAAAATLTATSGGTPTSVGTAVRPRPAHTSVGTAVSPPPAPGQGPVIGHVTRALAAHASDVVRTVTTGPGGWQGTNWFSQDASRTLRPGADIGYRRSGASYVSTFVTYPGKKIVLEDTTKRPQPGFSLVAVMGLRGPGDSLAGCPRSHVSSFADSNWSYLIRTLLSCGGFKVTGHAHIGGTAVIVLTGPATKVLGGPDTYYETLLVNAATYLPFRLITNNTAPNQYSIYMSFQWLPPTAANLAHLTVPIPPGSRISKVSN